MWIFEGGTTDSNNNVSPLYATSGQYLGERAAIFTNSPDNQPWLLVKSFSQNTLYNVVYLYEFTGHVFSWYSGLKHVSNTYTSEHTVPLLNQSGCRYYYISLG